MLEIGPGAGALTSELLSRGRRVAAVEIDRDLARGLRERFPADRLWVTEGDILAIPFREVARMAGWPEGAPFAVAGNLPYNISKPVAMRVVQQRADVDRAVLMYQREVAERLIAGPGTRSYGPLSVLVGTAYDVAIAFDLPPSAFRPAPKVWSSVTVWSRRQTGAFDDAEMAALSRCLATCFAHRRRTLLNNLRAALPGGEAAARALLEAAGIAPDVRAEAVAPARFVALSRAWPEDSVR